MDYFISWVFIFWAIKTKVPKAKANGNQYDDEYRFKTIILLFTTEHKSLEVVEKRIASLK
jgi:nitrogen fixation-related uncharacterized protein